MNVPGYFLSGFLLAILPTAGLTQAAGPMAPAMPPLFVRFGGPPGTQVVVYPGGQVSRPFEAPATVGLRPGYIYRVQLTNLPGHPGLSLFPTIEVRGTLVPPPGLNPIPYAVPVVVTPADVNRVLAGAFITKVIYLECPDVALPVASNPEVPLETEMLPNHDLLAEARLLGRPLLVVRLGQRDVAPEEMAGHAIAGTVLLPGEATMGPPMAPPCLPAVCWDMVDPRLGPRFSDCECLKDGGDAGAPVGFGPDGRLHGLDPADTVAEYTCADAERRIAISNRVCLFAPRFAVLRNEVGPVGANVVQSLAAAEAATPPLILRERLKSQELRQIVELAVAQSRQRASELEVIQGMVEIKHLTGLVVAVGVMGTAEVVGVCPPPRPPQPCKLALCKTADKQAVRVGEVVTFTLKYTNQGGQPISGIVVSDSLINRLEYVPGSAMADRDAVFTTQANEAGSLVLRWAIGGTLPPGQSGTLQFQARVR